MIRMIQSLSAGQAKSYFRDALIKSDYYLDDQELPGLFRGRIAERMGLSGIVDKESFYNLTDNINPKTKQKLTARTNEKRRVGYDINFHCPKTLSVLHALSKDDHILNAFQTSVHDTMREIEADAMARVRKGGKNDNRKTSELIWSEFIHQTARPSKDRVPDPHLHAHCFTFNVTWDEEETQYKAGEFGDIMRDMPYYQAAFHKRLSDNLIDLGYQIRRTDKAFEIEGVPQKVIDLFSKRTDEIGRAAKELGITDPDEKAKLGALTRGKKQKGFSMDELKAHWRQQIRDAGMDGEDDVVIRYGKAKEFAYPKETTHDESEKKVSDNYPLDLPSPTPQGAVDHALQHCFERASVMNERRLLMTAIRHATGHKTLSLNRISEAFHADKRIIRVQDGPRMVCTTKEVLAEEKRMVALAQAGKGKMKPLYRQAPTIDLEGELKAAALHVLTTPHRVSIVRGRAGVGKTTMLKKVVPLVQKVGIDPVIVAPSSEASRSTLRKDGFDKADTVARLLLDKEMQKKLQNGMLILDEGGLLGTKAMTDVLELATRFDARVIILGDTRQHSSVVRGDALRILNTVGGIRVAEVSTIFRQRREDYKEAVQHLADGNVRAGFEKLDAIDAITETDGQTLSQRLIDDYIASVKKKKSALIISPTHKQGDAITDQIRTRLRNEKKLGKKEIILDRLVNLNMTEAEKNDMRNYQPGLRLQFEQNHKGIKRGSVWEIVGKKDKTLHIKNDDGTTINMLMSDKKTFDVYHKTEIVIAKGDRIRMTHGGFDAKKQRLENGQIFDVLKVGKRSMTVTIRNVISKKEYALPTNYRNLAHAHCITSHASQGKTVDEVFILQPAATFPATDLKQFYVSVSRGRDKVTIYTDDKSELLKHASEIGDRQSAIELVNGANTRHAERTMRNDMQRQTNTIKQKEVEKPEPVTPRSHEREPEI